jgi:two-component sensor histidine kinase
VWSESGGPPVAEPKWRGFGSHLIEQNLARSLEAEISLTFPPDGVRCRMAFRSR